MIRVLIAAVFLAAAAAPAFACSYMNSVTNDTHSRTAASQPTDDQGTPPPAKPADQKPS